LSCLLMLARRWRFLSVFVMVRVCGGIELNKKKTFINTGL
jgi:hypothetical protein